MALNFTKILTISKIFYYFNVKRLKIYLQTNYFNLSFGRYLYSSRKFKAEQLIVLMK